MQKLTSVSALFIVVLVAGYDTSQQAVAKPSTYEVEFRENVMVAMRDGVQLATHVWLPKAQGSFPVLLMRTPYGKGDADGRGAELAAQGYVCVTQDCRGRGDSGGEWKPLLNEGADGRDMHQWILERPWCNGSIGTFGGSYVGFTQWISAPGAGRYLKAMLPTVALGDAYHDVNYAGAITLSLTARWCLEMALLPDEEPGFYEWEEEQWSETLSTLPLTDIDQATLGRDVDYLDEWLAHANLPDDPYWEPGLLLDDLKKVKAPTLGVGGWYDIFSHHVLERFEVLRNAQPRKGHRALMGPWGHGINAVVGELEFGEDAENIDGEKMMMQWFDHWMKGARRNGVKKWAPLRIFVMGRNEWRDEEEWPLARTEYTRYYFHSDGGANTLSGDGTLSPASPGSEPADRYDYDPADPVPTHGGCLLDAPGGPLNQTGIEQRGDVLVYTTAPLTEEVEVTGPVKVVLYASSSALDTDWTAKLVDVHPDGRAFNLCDGIVRARYRESATKAAFLVPGDVYQYEISVSATSNVFLPGHRIRIEISSSNFPRFDRNLNTGGDIVRGTDMEVAHQTIYHDADHASHIVLPIIEE